MKPAAGDRPRIAWQRVDGVLLLDKPVGMSSNGALQAARRLFRAEKGGHTGTLDPLASGLLPLCFGEATKFAGELLEADKEYLATVQLGVTTDTADAEGNVLVRRPVDVSASRIEAVLGEFVGDIAQVPPMYSALKRDGKPLYAYARAGVEVERAARRVRIHALRLESGTPDPNPDRFDFRVRCSKGTYVRTLAADIGERLGCGAHLAALRRTAIGPLALADAVTVREIETLSPGDRAGRLRPCDFLLAALAGVVLDPREAGRLRQGQSIARQGPPGERVRAYDEAGRFLGLCLQSAPDMMKPLRLVATHQAKSEP